MISESDTEDHLDAATLEMATHAVGATAVMF
jgi:hypothetical protein